jgi:peptide methionine sulfoxide reductase msrA/msrB
MPVNWSIIIALVITVGLIVVLGCAQEGRPASPPDAGAASHPGAGAASMPSGDGGDGGAFQGHIYNEAGELIGPVELAGIEMPEEQWQTLLTAEQFRILRKAGTERAGTGALLKNKAEGTYTCAACKLPLFASATKFESGTGWPSFYQAIARGNVAEHQDRSLGMVRTEVLCARCGGHLGHVFDDGPRPTGLRYCMNSAALAFTPADQLATLAETLPPTPDTKSDEGPGDAPADDQAMTPATTTAPGPGPTPAPTPSPAPGDAPLAKAVFAGGCFWCVEAVFEELDGVKEAISGYAGGTKETANYQAVGSGRTNHAEAVEIIYDPAKIAYEDLLRVHFATHDPTQLNRQGNDVGPQYRSSIFYANEDEKALAEAIIADLNDQKVFTTPIVTKLEPLDEFYAAETYHQNYVCNNPMQGYVRGVALPKVEKVRKLFADRLKETSPLEKK